MGFFSNQVERRFLRPGDHIYSWRAIAIYAHHGIFIGEDGGVVHFCGPWKSTQKRGEPCAACEMLEHSDRDSGVIVSCLDCFLNSGKLYRYEYGVSVVEYLFRRRGTCNTAVSSEVEVVLERAENLLRQNGLGEYDVFNNNCEDFATYCKTGQPCNRYGRAPHYGQASYFPMARRPTI